MRAPRTRGNSGWRKAGCPPTPSLSPGRVSGFLGLKFRDLHPGVGAVTPLTCRHRSRAACPAHTPPLCGSRTAAAPSARVASFPPWPALCPSSSSPSGRCAHPSSPLRAGALPLSCRRWAGRPVHLLSQRPVRQAWPRPQLFPPRPLPGHNAQAGTDDRNEELS